jgi:hypothetical protein
MATLARSEKTLKRKAPLNKVNVFEIPQVGPLVRIPGLLALNGDCPGRPLAFLQNGHYEPGSA